jgi:uncharacterized repeat protein (TIGR02543 family)
VNVSSKNADGTPVGGNVTSPSFSPQPTKYPTSYTCDASYTLTAVPNAAAGYHFVGWTGDNTSTANPITLSVKDGIAKSVVANFAFKPEAISMADAIDLMNNQPGPLLLDVSSEDNFNNSHILCARNYPWSALRKQFDVGIANLNPYKTNTILMYDQTGARSKAAAEYLAERGFAYIKYMTAGLDDWMAAGYDTYVPAEDADICTSLAPMAHAGNAQTVNEGVRVNLDGSESTDPTGGALTYAWSQFKGSPDVALTGADKDRAAFTSPFLTSGDAELVFHLTVTNSAGQKHSDSTIVNIVWFNDPPAADAGGDQIVETGEKVTLDGSGSNDPEGQSLSYRWRRSGGTLYPSLSNDTDIAPTFTAPNNSGDVEFTLTVTDNNGKTHTDTVTVTVQSSTPANIRPVADAAADSTSVSPGETVTLDGSGSSDPDGTIAAYVWEQTDTTGKTVALSDATAVKPTFTAPEVTETTILKFTLMVTDDDDAVDTDMVEITVNKPVVNQAPTAVAAADKTSVSPGETVILDGSGSSDPDGTIVAYAWEQTDATGKTVALSDATAVKPIFTAPEVTETITLIFKLTVTDSSGDSATSTVRITVAKPSSGGSGGGCFIHTLEEGI